MSPREIHILCGSIGDRLGGLYRVHFLYQGNMDTRYGELTLVFESEKTVRLLGTPHGYDLSVAAERWSDPFGEPLSEEDREPIEEAGQLVEVSLNEQPEWQPFVGQRLTAVGRLIYIDHDEPCGVAFRFNQDRVLLVYNLADEVMVQHSNVPAWLQEQPVCAGGELQNVQGLG